MSKKKDEKNKTVTGGLMMSQNSVNKGKEIVWFDTPKGRCWRYKDELDSKKRYE